MGVEESFGFVLVSKNVFHKTLKLVRAGTF